MMPARAASTTAPSEASSHGCATAVGVAVMPLQRASSCSYFPVPRLSVLVITSVGMTAS